MSVSVGGGGGGERLGEGVGGGSRGCETLYVSVCVGGGGGERLGGGGGFKG